MSPLPPPRMTRRIMYIERKEQAREGRGRIGWVEQSSSCRVYRYAGMVLHKSIRGQYNCFDAGSGELWLITDPKANGRDKLHGGYVDIDADAREEYWLRIRNQPDSVALESFLADPRVTK